MRYTKENIVDGIYAKLDEIFKVDSIYKPVGDMFKLILINYPEEIEQNVLEWVNGDPLTEVDCHGVSIKDIVETRNLSDAHMPQIIKNFITFKKNGFKGSNVCYWQL